MELQRWAPDLAGLHCPHRKLLPAGLDRFTELFLELANGGILVIDEPMVAYLLSTANIGILVINEPMVTF